MIATPRNNGDQAQNTITEQKALASDSFVVNSSTAMKKDYGKCAIRKGKVPDYPIQSTFTASYPGSGAKMTWKLIEAMTGLVTGDDFQLNGHTNIVSIKTHYPSSEGRQINAEHIPRAMLLIRNPLHSIPSYFNFVYEYENNLPGHSTKAPLEEWIKWRNDNFDRQVQVWRRHTEYWMDAYDKLHRMVISYEKMIDDDLGPAEAMKIAQFLNKSDGVTTVAPEEIPCVWYNVIKYKKGRRRLGVVLMSEGTNENYSQVEEETSFENRNEMSEASSKNGSSYYQQTLSGSSATQYSQSIISTPSQKGLQMGVRGSSTMEDVQYQEMEASTNTRTNSQEDIDAPKVVSPKGKSGFFANYDAAGTGQRESVPKATPPGKMSSFFNYQGSGGVQNGGEYSSAESFYNTKANNQDIEGIDEREEFSPMVTPPSKTDFFSKNKSSGKVQDYEYSSAASLKVNNQDKGIMKGNLRGQGYPELEKKESMQMEVKSKSASQHYPELGNSKSLGYSQGEATSGKTRTQQNPGSSYSERNGYGQESAKTYAIQDQKRGPQHIAASHSLNVSHRSGETKDEIQSKRGGPKYTAPFNPQQLKDLIQVLTQLLERYRDDKDLAPILVSYIDEAAKRSEGPPEDENTVVVQG